jgi:ubiquinone/menaquinone biosynthesis C-methylase UbiE
MKKADYSKIASTYDKGRPLLEQNTDLWMNLISEHSGSGPGAQVLDLGCGTGRFTIPMATQLNFSMIGADSSTDMLEKARVKDTEGLIKWDTVNADDIGYREKSFDIVFMSHLLHHVDNPLKVVKDCQRIISNGGNVLIRYGAIEQIREDPEHVFFPEVLPIDEARTPSIATVESWLKDAGFSEVKSVNVVQITYESPEARFQAASVRSTSVLSMISDDAFKRGLQRMEKYINETPEDPWLIMDSITLSIGYKKQT